MTSLFCSASTTASCTHFMAVSKSTISPLRTPRDGACPTPRILTVPSGRLSPTTTQIFDVPISRPTIKSLLAISFLLFSLLERHGLANFHRPRARMRFFRDRRGTRRQRFQDLGRRRFRIDRFVNDGDGSLGKRHRNVALYDQIHSGEFAL